VTPTGAAIVAACASFEPAHLVSTEHEGYGAGSADLDWPNVMRVAIGELDEGSGQHYSGVVEQQGQVQLDADWSESQAIGARRETVMVIETNIDDMAPNLLAEIPRAMLEAGALEAFVTAVVMKKGRPGHLVTVVCAPAQADSLAAKLLRETSTLGVRIREERRLVLKRRVEKFSSSLGEVAVKLKLIDGKVVDAMPEYDDVRVAADRAAMPVAEAHRVLSEEARREFVGALRGRAE
jgi:uncharacterized protein (DUF111 family)